jgi:hypothetical protein
MKYQHILNNELLFETDDPGQFVTYLMTDQKAQQAKYNVLYNLLEKSGGYICKLMNTKSSA